MNLLALQDLQVVPLLCRPSGSKPSTSTPPANRRLGHAKFLTLTLGRFICRNALSVSVMPPSDTADASASASAAVPNALKDVSATALEKRARSVASAAASAAPCASSSACFTCGAIEADGVETRTKRPSPFLIKARYMLPSAEQAEGTAHEHACR